MSNEYKTILFTSNLSNASRIAFKQAAMLAKQSAAKLILLHIMEGQSSGSYEGYVSSLFGHDSWQKIVRNNREEAKHALVGKVTPKQMVRTALSQFCKENQSQDEDYEFPNYEIVVINGDVVEIILEQAVEHKCDLIVMGASEGLLSGISVGKNIKSILRKTKIPVLVVPASAG